MLWVNVTLFSDMMAHVAAGQFSTFQDTDDFIGPFTKTDGLKQGLFSTSRPHRTGTHRKVLFPGDLPARILGRHAGCDRLIGSNRHGWTETELWRTGDETDLAQSGQANFRQSASRF